MSKESKTMSVVNFQPGEVVIVINAENPRMIINAPEANVAQVLPFMLPFFNLNKPAVKHIEIRTIPAPDTKIYFPETPSA